MVQSGKNIHPLRSDRRICLFIWLEKDSSLRPDIPAAQYDRALRISNQDREVHKKLAGFSNQEREWQSHNGKDWKILLSIDHT